MAGHLEIRAVCGHRTAVCILLFLGVCSAGETAPPNRFANTASAVVSTNYNSRLFIGRGMVVSPARTDFFGLGSGAVTLDTDTDGLADVFDPDNDADDLDDLDEIEVYGTNPSKLDTDDDGMPDDWELAEGFNPLSTADGDQDADGDGVSNVQELEDGTNPHQYVLQLAAGWNLVSIARVPVDYTVSGILGDVQEGPAWGWSGHRLTPIEFLTPLDGYWVYCPAEGGEDVDLGALEFPADADGDGDGFSDSQEIDRDTNPNRYVIHLSAGWNLVSLARRPDNNTIEALFPHLTRGPAWYWAGDHYDKAEGLQPLLGYWVFSPAGGDAVINLP